MWRLALVMFVIARGDAETTSQQPVPCTPDTSLPLQHVLACYRNGSIATSSKTSICTYSCETSSTYVTWRNLSSNGNYDVSFLLPDESCGHTKYKIDLRINEDLTPDECETAHETQFKETHTRRIYNIYDNMTNCSPCNKTGVVSFRYIFTGCYRLILQPRVNDIPQKSLWSCPMYLHSNYKKTLLANDRPTFLPHYTNSTRLITNFTYAPFSCTKLYVSLDLLKIIGNASCMKSTLQTQCHTNMDNELNNTLKCNSSRSSCNISTDEMTCSFDDVIPGNYCVHIDISDDRCDAGTLWTENDFYCKWYFSYQAVGSPPNDPVGPFHGDASTYVLAVCLIVLAIILAGVGVWGLCRLTRPSTPPRVRSVQSTMVPVSSDILLLYARDCPRFMLLMAALRKLLQKASSRKVYDCFDSANWEEMSLDSLGWIRQLTQRRDVKIVVVASKCAKLRQQAASINHHLRYRDPTSYDALFLAAIKAIQETQPIDVYSRVYVVRFQDFADDIDLFANLNSYTRFVLPVHLTALLHQLTRSNIADRYSQLDQSEEWKEMHKSLTELITYKNQHANYLQNMLIVDNPKIDI